MLNGLLSRSRIFIDSRRDIFRRRRSNDKSKAYDREYWHRPNGSHVISAPTSDEMQQGQGQKLKACVKLNVVDAAIAGKATVL